MSSTPKSLQSQSLDAGESKKIDPSRPPLPAIQEETKKVSWSPENEVILVEWCDFAQCYKWMHSQSHNNYANWNACFTIPAITLSTISGTASFAQASLPVAYQVYAPMIIGTINIMIGIFTTIQQYLKISELNEAHRVATIAWDKYARNIRIELAKAPKERMDAGQFLKICRQELDRLMETCPSIPNTIVARFFSEFTSKNKTKEELEHFKRLKKPDVCNIIVSANDYRHHWYIDASNNRALPPPVEPDDEEPMPLLPDPTTLAAITAMSSISTKLNQLMEQSDNIRKEQQSFKEQQAIEMSHKFEEHTRLAAEELAEQLRQQAEKEAEELRLKTEELKQAAEKAAEELRLKEAEELRQAAEQEKKDLTKSIIEDYLSAFEKSQGRTSLKDETIEHFKTDVESQNKMDMDFLLEYLASRENVQLSGDV